MAKVIIIVGENKWELTDPQKWLLVQYIIAAIDQGDNLIFIQPQEPHLKYSEKDEELVKLITDSIDLAINTIETVIEHGYGFKIGDKISVIDDNEDPHDENACEIISIENERQVIVRLTSDPNQKVLVEWDDEQWIMIENIN